MATVYKINKGVNKSLEFRGIKAQYIVYLAAGLGILFILFVILYLAGCNSYFSLGLIVSACAGLGITVSRLSKKFGQYGLQKKIEKQKLPQCIKSKTWKTFFLYGK